VKNGNTNRTTLRTAGASHKAKFNDPRVGFLHQPKAANLARESLPGNISRLLATDTHWLPLELAHCGRKKDLRGGAVNRSQENLLKLAAASRNDKKQFRACCELAKKLNLKSPKRQPKQQSASSKTLQNFVRRIPAKDMHNAIAKFGTTAVFNRVQADSILQTAAQKFTEQAIRKAGR